MIGYFSRKHLLLIVAFFAFGLNQLSAQQKEWQNWNSIGLKVPISKMVDFKLSELASLSPANGYGLNFAQTSAAFSIDLTKLLSVKVGDQLNYIPGSTNALRNRIFVAAGIDNRFSTLIKAEHSLQAELHSKTETRYHQRFIITNALSLRRRFSILHLRPSVSYSLYYNMGGSPLQYYDKAGDPTVKQKPDGFHRGRFYARLNSRITRHVQLTLYYMDQSEFNFLSPADKNINVLNPSTGRIARPYDEYNVVGLSLLFSIRNDN